MVHDMTAPDNVFTRLPAPAGPMRLGTCYYPEHWPQDWWAQDARAMAAMGLARVRIGEFAWSRIEPEPGRFDWDWLDRAIATLADAGLGIILGTPTATPPKWLVDAMPDMIAIDARGRPRRFGSRRHYCFSHAGYRGEAARITAALAQRYGDHPGVVGWQTDNEYGCHDTTISYSAAALAGFRLWLAARYGSIDALNTAWGTMFWSMDYRSFDEIDLPHLTVTVPHPAHVLAFRRYSSDQVVAFNRAQVTILRAASPGRDICHNFMGFYTEFDHHDVGADLDVAAWDSYPLGFLEQFWFSDSEKADYARAGHPDIAAFHHDLYRGCSGGRWSVMEQQPGPVNWARYNPAPLPGMVRLWTMEACAHGAELVSYFRWRQAPFAQEQMHAGLMRPDRAEAPAADEVREAAADIALLGPTGAPPRSVALVFSYPGDWVTEIEPHGAGQRALRQAFDWYSALRRMGFDIDIVSAHADLSGYALVVLPCVPVIDDALVDRLALCEGEVVIGARGGSKTTELAIPPMLAPGAVQRLVPVTVARVESLRPGMGTDGPDDGTGWRAQGWIEQIESDLSGEMATGDGAPTVWRKGHVRYVSVQGDAAYRDAMLAAAARDAGLEPMAMAEGVRVRRAGGRTFVVNYAAEPRVCPEGVSGSFLIGEPVLPPAGVAVLAG
jgi:beta-galactosidase